MLKVFRNLLLNKLKIKIRIYLKTLHDKRKKKPSLKKLLKEARKNLKNVDHI
jgi:hypothetical protein